MLQVCVNLLYIYIYLYVCVGWRVYVWGCGRTFGLTYTPSKRNAKLPFVVSYTCAYVCMFGAVTAFSLLWRQLFDAICIK